MDSAQFLGYTTFLYLAATIIYVGMLIFKIDRLGLLATALTIVGVSANTIGIVLRWVESYRQGIGYIPLSNMYESLVFFAWTIAVTYLVIERVYKTRYLGGYILSFAFLAMAYASISTEFSKDIKPLLPALQSNWLAAHVITCFIGYAAFTIAGGLAILYLIKTYSTGNIRYKASVSETKTPNLEQLDDIIYKMIIFGFLWLTVGIITGAVWANSAWGTYWSWDPKETWSLITWFVYALALHARYTRGWSGTRMAWVALVGFLSVIFTYYGVNFLLSGLHSYGG
ncbi:MAG: cytochrome C biogenesis protein ResC [Desulfobulbaceae bacterium BRH_c16a]|nr:MAG: cytochrome C biogenesis protein ResC [Desulfobulbaceae bacterium BRH_c16a]